jgi:hypothetical protein
MQTAPTAISHHCWLSDTSVNPASPATAKATNAAARTVDGVARFDPTSRSGPTRSSSVPRMPSE